MEKERVTARKVVWMGWLTGSLICPHQWGEGNTTRHPSFAWRIAVGSTHATPSSEIQHMHARRAAKLCLDGLHGLYYDWLSRVTGPHRVPQNDEDERVQARGIQDEQGPCTLVPDNRPCQCKHATLERIERLDCSQRFLHDQQRAHLTLTLPLNASNGFRLSSYLSLYRPISSSRLLSAPFSMPAVPPGVLVPAVESR